MTPNSFPTSMKASTHWLTSAVEWAAMKKIRKGEGKGEK